MSPPPLSAPPRPLPHESSHIVAHRRQRVASSSPNSPKPVNVAQHGLRASIHTTCRAQGCRFSMCTIMHTHACGSWHMRGEGQGAPRFCCPCRSGSPAASPSRGPRGVASGGNPRAAKYESRCVCEMCVRDRAAGQLRVPPLLRACRKVLHLDGWRSRIKGWMTKAADSLSGPSRGDSSQPCGWRGRRPP